MQFGTCILWDQSREEFEARVRLAESLGYDYIGINDSQSLHRETYAALAVMAGITTTASIGPYVTNPVTRHPAVAAAAIATVDELSGGRARFAIGAGASALFTIGMKPLRVAEFGEYVRAVRHLLHGETAEWRGVELEAHWPPRRVPVVVGGYGPKTIEMGAGVADGVSISSSTSPRILIDLVELVRDAEVAAGRAAGTCEIWVMLRGSVRSTRDEAVDDVKASLAAAAKSAFSKPTPDPYVPEALQPKIVELLERYVDTEHVVAGGQNAALVDELGLTDYLADRFAVAGTAEECAARIRELESVGVDRVMLPAVDRDPDLMLRRFAELVRPLV